VGGGGGGGGVGGEDDGRTAKDEVLHPVVRKKKKRLLKKKGRGALRKRNFTYICPEEVGAPAVEKFRERWGKKREKRKLPDTGKKKNSIEAALGREKSPRIAIG